MHLPLSLRSTALLLALIVLMAVVAPVRAQTNQRIAAVVNNDVISAQDLTSRIDLAVIFSGLPNDEAARRRLAPQVMRRMIDERLQLQEARDLGLVASDAEVVSAIGRLAEPNGMSADELLNFLTQRGIVPGHLRDQVQAELSWVRLVRRRLAPRVAISDQQVDLALDAESRAGEQDVLLSEILLPVYNPARQDEVIDQALELMVSIREGSDFEALASQVSVGTTADAGGDLGWVAISSLAAGLRPAVVGLQPGQLSEPVRSPAGVHLFLVRDRRAGRSIANDPQARRLAQIFFPLPANATTEAIELSRAQATALRTRLATCEDVIATAAQLGAPSSGDLGWLRPEELPPGLASILDRIPVEEISQPVQSRSGIHLLMVCARGGEGDEEGRRARTRRKLERAQVQRLANRYLRDLRKDAYIDIRVDF